MIETRPDIEQTSGQGTTQAQTLPPVRLIAFYLPQFHPIPENDEWWGKGFTEWTAVASARPLFRGHCQPRIPSELGFYDLRVPEARTAQAELARAHGISAFCYWHYWFGGKQLLERPFAEVLRSGEPDFPFCLAWANESWERRWVGRGRGILLEQTYSPKDDLDHVRWLEGAFADDRYIRVDGRPLFLFYRPLNLLNPRRTTDTFRSECLRLGLPEPYLVGMNSHSEDADMRALGFDLTEHHEPQIRGSVEASSLTGRLLNAAANLRLGVASARPSVRDYAGERRRLEATRPAYPHFPCLFVGWDNTPRRGRDGIVMVGATPARVGAALERMVNSVLHKSFEQRIVFLNAWNEWGEGMYLEPDDRYGGEMLRAVDSVIQRCSHNIDPRQSLAGTHA